MSLVGKTCCRVGCTSEPCPDDQRVEQFSWTVESSAQLSCHFHLHHHHYHYWVKAFQGHTMDEPSRRADLQRRDTAATTGGGAYHHIGDRQVLSISSRYQLSTTLCHSTNSAEIHNLLLEDEDIPPSLVMPSKQEQFCRCDFHGIDYLEDYYRYGKTCFETGQDHMAVETIKLMLATYTLVTELDDNLQYSTNFHAPQHKRLN
ncbi:hypothetical protein OsJ_35334 [Oryza sativa Japonica Group]|uniref:Uncharacterized protein n=2 Tax=Oryza sativa subsp. japonica TaxID=39947 RepID=B9GC15_ORYSJ|nr:hypothetical protein OsJ_35334 [Oryza sativa Japonica Group]